MPEPLLVPWKEKGPVVSIGFIVRISVELKKLQMQAMTNGEHICNQCQCHGFYCLWPPEGAFQKTCDPCAVWKSPCTIQGVQVSNWKQWEQSGAEGSRPQKKSQVEVEEDAELDGSGAGGWKVWGLQDISFALIQMRENLEERNELLREQNGYLQRIASYLDRGEVHSREEELEEDSTVRE